VSENRLLSLAAAAAVLGVTGSSLRAQNLLERTELVDIRIGTGHSEMMRAESYRGYELSDGTPLRFRRWYGSDWQDLHFTFVTPITSNFGVYWGFGTGESGEKYRISPRMKLGFVAQTDLSPQETVSLSATVVIGGRLTEDSCIADYEEIGGVQEVNCRLAASFLPPAETLDLLYDEPPPDRLEMTLRYTYRF